MSNNNLTFLSPPLEVDMADEWFDMNPASHFWMIWRFKVISRYYHLFGGSDSKIFEIGCGNGVVLNQFNTTFGKLVDGCDLNLVALKKVQPKHGRIYVYNIFDQNADLVGKYDAVLLLDVIEHIANDQEFLKAGINHLKKGGYAIISVPAFNWLFSKYDKLNGHKRRYTKRSLRKLGVNCGLTPVYLGYWGISLLPIIFVRKLTLSFVKNDSVMKRGFSPPIPFANSIFKVLMKIELNTIRNPPIGSSVYGIFRLP